MANVKSLLTVMMRVTDVGTGADRIAAPTIQAVTGDVIAGTAIATETSIPGGAVDGIATATPIGSTGSIGSIDSIAIVPGGDGKQRGQYGYAVASG